MGEPNPIPPLPRPEETRGFHPPTHGNWAQWAAIAVAITIPFVLRHCDRAASQDVENFSLRVDARIDAKINPAIEKINGHTDTKADELSKRVDGLSERVSHIEGQLDKRVSSLERRVDQQVSLAKLLEPSHIFRTIRAELQAARASGKPLPVSDLDSYKNAVQAFPASAREYWTTVAEIINFQSWINQQMGIAPDPSKVSKPCIGVTRLDNNRNLSMGNEFAGAPIFISNCIADLDTQAYSGVVLTDSVINYHGGPTTLSNVTFVNCRFILDLPESLPAPAHPEVLHALLNSDQKRVTLSTHS